VGVPKKDKRRGGRRRREDLNSTGKKEGGGRGVKHIVFRRMNKRGRDGRRGVRRPGQEKGNNAR